GAERSIAEGIPVKLNDALSGAIFLALAIFIFVYAIALPPMPGQRYGAGTFPVVLALGMGGFSLLLIVQALRRRMPDTRWIAFAEWARDRRTLGNFGLALALVLVYVVLSERIGFIPLSIAILLVLFSKQGVPWRRGLAVAVAATLAIQVSFSDLLRVPLPRGILTTILW
ncbi:MAG: tripartite tricarboxylate transporter TctB family protein, partial [Alphaproteobacteria bacterium]